VRDGATDRAETEDGDLERLSGRRSRCHGTIVGHAVSARC